MTQQSSTAAQDVTTQNSANAELEKIVGPIVNNGLTETQQNVLAAAIFLENVQALKDNEFMRNTLLTTNYDNLFLYAPNEKHTDEDKQMLRTTHMLTANAQRIVLKAGDARAFTEYNRNKDNHLPGFAGMRCKEHCFPTANTWYEVDFKGTNKPRTVPLRDVLFEQAPLVTIRRISIHAICNNIVNPFPSKGDSAEIDKAMGDSRFLKEATVISIVEIDGQKGPFVYAGNISYGVGGADIYRVNTLSELRDAMTGENPNPSGDNRLTGIGQYVCGTLAYLIAYFGHDFETLKSSMSQPPQTDFTHS